uniref:GMC oxidoreductase n=1 Tax=Cyanothece sp. (strain PCC 7425 / ATCC 29141) TaxID=395961 RepID=B8HV76_CYAP4
MIIDARSLPADEELKTQVCIVGAGPAGITLAREFADQDFQVCLLESGGLNFDPEIQALADGIVMGDPYPKVSDTRMRQFGGTSHLWEGQVGYKEYGFRCLPLDQIDFEQREWLPYSGWPFSKAHLDPYYARAHEVCQLGPYAYNVDVWENEWGSRLPFKSDRITTSMSQYAPRYPFTEGYREQIKRCPNITTILYANVVEILTDETRQTVTRLRIASAPNRHFWLTAKLFILATGGLENARLLLASHQQQTAGLGNEHDLVGRFFMDRPILSCHLLPYRRTLFDQTSLYDIYRHQGVATMAWLHLSEAVMRREKLMNNGAQLFPRPLPRQRQATLALRSLIRSIKNGKPLEDKFKYLREVLRGSDYAFAAGFWTVLRQLPGLRRGDWSYLPYEKQRFSEFEIFYQIEQAPDPSNRVTLSSERDRYGQPKTEIYWRLNPIDIEHATRVQQIWAEEFERAGLGKLQFAHKREDWQLEKIAMHHHMGTTRMHHDPRQGVVDANAKMHGITNLFVAGSSVFPTSGYANPTLTIIALAIRLADQIKALMK